MRFKTILIALFVMLTLTQCISYDFSRRYVQQGNLMPDSKLERLKIGMSKEDAAILMGTSLISPLFNNDRWDYVYTWRKGANAPLIKRISLYFVHGRLSRIER